MPHKLFSKILNRPEEPYVRPSLERTESTDSIASDATAPNNPGPGRNVGRLYDTLGSRLEYFLKRRSGAGAEQPYAHLSLQLFRTVSVDSIDSIASDATAPNNPGPGRNLGRLYDALGTMLEVFLRRRTGRLKRGPDIVAQAIRELRRYREDFRFDQNDEVISVQVVDNPLSPTEEQKRTLKKLCRRLLKYCRSHVLATQLRALDEATALAIEDPYVRGILVGVLHHSYLVPKYKETELRLSSLKTMVSIKDNEIHDIWSHYKSSNDQELENQLTGYLSNPDVSFLVARLLRKEFDEATYVLPSQRAWDYYIEIAFTKPQIIEWDSLNAFFKYQFEGIPEFIRSHANQILRLARLIPDFSLYENDGTLLFKQPNNASRDLSNLEYRSQRICICLGYMCNSDDLAVQLWYLRNLAVDTRDLLQDSIFGNEILVAHARIYCKKDNVHLTRGAESCLPEATVMLFYYFNGTPDEKALAKIVISRSIELNRYIKYALDTLLSQYGGRVQLLNAPQLNNKQFFLSRILFSKSNHRLFRKEAGMHNDDLLCMYGSFINTLWIHVIGDEHSFDVTGHFPVLAGYDSSGRELYIARVWVSNSTWHTYTYVSDGARSISFLHDDGKWRTADRFSVLVLRHDPCDVGVQAIPPNAKFQTGPAYWIREGDDNSDSDSDSEVDSETSSVSGSDSTFDLEERFVELGPDASSSNSLEEAEDDGLRNLMESGDAPAHAVEELDLRLEVLAAADTDLCATLENTTDSRDMEVLRFNHPIEAQQQELEDLRDPVSSRVKSNCDDRDAHGDRESGETK